MTTRVLALVFAVIGCGATADARAIPPPCSSTRTFVVSADAAQWEAPIRWAAETWRGAVPSVVYRFEDGDATPAQCVTPVRLQDFNFAETHTLGETDGGSLLFDTSGGLSDDGMRALALHELGHLLFGLGHSTDPSSAMYPVIHTPPALTRADVDAARTAR